MNTHVRWFRRVVRLLPADFQADYAADMERTFLAQAREVAAVGGFAAVMYLWWETMIGLLKTAPREHLAQLRQDIGYALRMMRRAPLFTAVAIMTLATGIGANTAMFSVARAVLIRPLPYADVDSLMVVWNHWPRSTKSSISEPELLDLRERLRTVDIAAWAGGAVNLLGRGDPLRLTASHVTPNLLTVLGVRPVLGRNFREDEERRGHDNVVLLTNRLWREVCGADPGIVGHSILLDGAPVTVIGVLPQAFAMPHEFAEEERSAVLLPLPLDIGAPRNERGSHYLFSAARLRPGISLARAQAELDATTRAFERENPGEYDPGYGTTLFPIRIEIVGDVRTALLVLTGAVAMVLLIACANVANLLVARGQVRSREVAVRKAIGASQARLVRQVITESLALSGAATLFGILLAQVLTALIVRSAADIPRLGDVRLDQAVLAFTAAVSILTAFVFGSLPAIQLARHDLGLHLRGQRAGRSHIRQAVRGMLVAAQVALALVLLVGAALLIQSFTRLLSMPSGFRPEHVLTFRASVPPETYRERKPIVNFFEQLLERIRALPGVSAAGGVGSLPLQAREIGVRMALGARAADSVRLVIRQGMTPAITGLLAGLVGAASMTRAIQRLLFETRATDPVTFAGMAVVLLTAALLACCVPARRAIRVDAATALRAE
jgi:putative ABC transport system permease protein